MSELKAAPRPTLRSLLQELYHEVSRAHSIALTVSSTVGELDVTRQDKNIEWDATVKNEDFISHLDENIKKLAFTNAMNERTMNSLEVIIGSSNTPE